MVEFVRLGRFVREQRIHRIEVPYKWGLALRLLG
jgi:hypothetical protein